MQTVSRFSLDRTSEEGNGTRPDGVEVIGSHGGVSFEVWTISPVLAAELLENVHNRPVKTARRKRYARIMTSGRWRLNYEWIGIDEYGYVIEGQHRLHGCVDSGVAFESLVLVNLRRELFPSLGATAPRGNADSIALVGAAQASRVAAALVYVFRAESGQPLYASGIGSRPENDESLALLAKHPRIAESVRSAGRCSRVFPSVAMLAYLHYEFQRRDPELADQFLSKLADGLGLKASDPAYVLRERLLADKQNKARLPNKYVLAITIKAWNYARSGRRAPKFLRWSEDANEKFPDIA